MLSAEHSDIRIPILVRIITAPLRPILKVSEIFSGT